MPHATKIATCTYCGTRAALVLRGDTRHELSCAACGAPLHDLKMLRADAVEARGGRPAQPARAASRPASRGPGARGVTPPAHWERMRDGHDDRPRRKKTSRKARKKRKGFMRKALEEAFDVLEDIFD
ncbi:hypothetical protein [Rhodosalinus sp. K401]|uniref:hypothetical protein n=1 Tax=Rhodosalinus sp. K401 TaxID=3239195 RepID=UPI0035235AEB